jgi:chaperonin GroES
MKFGLTPLGKRVIVKPVEMDLNQHRLIQIQERVKQIPQTGIIMALGKHPEVRRTPIKPGDKVVWRRYGGGTPITHDGEDYVIVKIKEVYAKLVDHVTIHTEQR